MKINGKDIAKNILDRLRQFPQPEKFLGVVLVGENSASEIFVRQKERTAKDLGVDFRIFRFPDSIGQEELENAVKEMGADKMCGGILVQIPLPDHIRMQNVMNAIPLDKDVEMMGEEALGSVYTFRSPVAPLAAGVVEEVLKNIGLDFRDARMTVLGLGNLVGKPVATWFLERIPEMHLIQRGGSFESLKEASVVVLGVGQAGIVTPEMISKHACVVDFGYMTKDGKPSGDFNDSNVPDSVTYTPTPGGTGPILVAKLFENFYTLVK